MRESNVHAKVDSFANLLVESQIRNFERYPILAAYVWPNHTIENSYGGEVFRLKTWITNRLKWMDNNISLIDQPEYDPDLEFEPIVLPNPVVDNSVIRYYASTRDLGYCIIFNLMGQKVFLQALYKSSTRDGFNELEIPPNLQPGIYFYKIIANEVEYGGKFEQM